MTPPVPYRQFVLGESDEEEGVIDGVAHQSRAAAEFSGPSVKIMVVRQSPVPQHDRDVWEGPL